MKVLNKILNEILSKTLKKILNKILNKILKKILNKILNNINHPISLTLGFLFLGIYLTFISFHYSFKKYIKKKTNFIQIFFLDSHYTYPLFQSIVITLYSTPPSFNLFFPL